MFGVIYSFDEINGVITLASDDLSLDQATVSVTIQCFSSDSTGSGSATEPITTVIEVVDKCRTSDIIIPDWTQTYFEKYLWEETFDPILLAYDTLGCGSLSHELVGLPEPTFLKQLGSNPGEIVLRTEALTAGELGQYPFSYRSCLTFTDGS